jgi:hypothetical protein
MYEKCEGLGFNGLLLEWMVLTQKRKRKQIMGPLCDFHAKFHQNWIRLAKPSSREIPNGSCHFYFFLFS